jgi:hypothetical protein
VDNTVDNFAKRDVVFLTLTRHNEGMNNNDPYENWDTPDTCYCPRNDEGSCMVCEKEAEAEDE